MSRRLITAAALTAVAALVAACGSQTISLSPPDKSNTAIKRGAILFAQRCGGCHTLSAAGTQGSATALKNRERVDGPNFDQRRETYDQVLYAIRNGGFSGAIMPQNVAVGADASDIAKFLAKYSGHKVTRPITPTPPPPGSGF
jgi:mono/diheme cytochrome c family protein